MSRVFTPWFLFVACIALASAGRAQTPPPAPAAAPAPAGTAPAAGRLPGEIRVASVKGDVYLAGSPPIHLRAGSSVGQQETVVTAKSSSIVLVFANGATVNLGENSKLSIEEFLQDPFTSPIKVSELTEEPTTSSTRLKLLEGELLSNVKTLHLEGNSKFEVQTPVGAAGIRGTTFQIFYRTQGNRASFRLTMVEGLVRLALQGVRPVDVPTNMQVSLPNIAIDPVTLAAKTVPAPGAPTSVPLSVQASLAESVQEAIGAASTITFEASTPTVSNTPPSNTPPTSPDAKTSGEAAATPSPDTNSPLPASPATEPAPRTTAGDGIP